EQLEQVGTAALDPEVHRVARDELRLRDLREHPELQARIDVAEEDERRAAELLGNLWPEVREYPEMRLERFRGVEVVTVAPTPAEREPVGAFESREIDRPLREGALQLLHRVVGAHDADELHGREMARRCGE